MCGSETSLSWLLYRLEVAKVDITDVTKPVPVILFSAFWASNEMFDLSKALILPVNQHLSIQSALLHSKAAAAETT